MKRWRFNLGVVGQNLRTKINDGEEDLNSCIATLEALEKCYCAIKGLLPVDEWEEICEEYDNIKEHLDILKLDEIERLDKLLGLGFDGYNPPLDCVNDDLRIFYNVCDDLRIWVGI